VDFALPATAAGPEGHRLAAVYASLPGMLRIGGQRRLALQSLDTLTGPDFRGRGLFVTLAKRMFERASESGVACIYGFPNGNSAHGFFKKLGWRSLDPVPFLIRPLRLDYVAARLKIGDRVRSFLPDVPLRNPFGKTSNDAVREVHSADERMTRLWNRFASKIGVAVDRDAAYLQWRLFDKPDEAYRTLVLEDGGELRALCSFAVKDKHGGRIGYVMELLCDPSARGLLAASTLLGAAVRSMSDEGADAVLAWVLPNSLTMPVFVRHLFFTLPEKLRPIELHFGVRAFDASVASIVGDRKNWYLSYLDSDTV
jgi:GNAT superfamily N-acetyltransferase